jgi:xanthine/uracil/vitamin C permease (AzgA family)
MGEPQTGIVSHSGRGRMSRDWRISTFNGALLASYFIPAWTIAALKIWISPIRGLYDRANVAPAMYVSDNLALSAITTIRLAWLLALAKVTVAAFFLVFLVLIVRESIRKKGSCDEALGFALGLGAFISMLSLMAASQVGELAALRLHASESLLLIGAAIILIVDVPKTPASEKVEERSDYPLGVANS